MKNVNKDLPGSDISFKDNSNDESCLKDCNANSQCLSAVINVSNRCYIKTHSRATGKSFSSLAGATFYEKVVPSQCPSSGELSLYVIKYTNSYCKEDGVGQWSGTHNIKRIAGVAYAQECSRHCQDEKNCIEFTFGNTSHCRLYSKYCTRSPSDTKWNHYTFVGNR